MVVKELTGWRGVAFNQVPHSQNEIHGDKMARDFGFKGGLVPGVTVSAYLLHPAADAFGMAFLERGTAHVKVIKPLYDEETFTVDIEPKSESAYTASLLGPDGTTRATASIEVPDASATGTSAVAPLRRGDLLADSDLHPPIATPENMAQLQAEGCRAFVYRWNDAHDMSTYLRNREEMAPCYREGFANPSFILGISNWVLASNAVMNPWVHMETRSRHFMPIGPGEKLVGEMHITDLFQKKGHEFVDAEINVFGFDDSLCRASINLRAIYRLRGS